MRIGTFSLFGRVMQGIRTNQFASLRAQEQLSSGFRILRPSDDPTGAASAIRLERQLADIGRFRSAINSGRTKLDTAASSLQDASSLMTEARELILQGMNGTLTGQDRESIAAEFDLLRAQLLDLGNLRSGDKYVFGGTQTSRVPWVEVTSGGRRRIVYQGNQESQRVRAGETVEVPIGLPGSEIFGKLEPSGTHFSGITGVSGGLTADEGAGFTTLVLRHDSTDLGTLGTVGVGLSGSGGENTFLGPNTLTIDPVAGTIQLGSGEPVAIPAPTDPGYADLVVKNELDGELHLDLTGWSGAAFSGTVTGNGSVSLDGVGFTQLSFGDTDMELRDDAIGAVVHIDATGIGREGEELVTFKGTTNVFDVMEGIAEDLRNAAGLDHSEIQERLGQRLDELDRNSQNVLVSMGVLGSRSQRLIVSNERALDVEVHLQGQLSNVRDADLAEVALDLARADSMLQAAQASGLRLIQTSLLDFLR